MKTLATRFSELLAQRANCLKSGNTEWLEKSTANIVRLASEYMPSGSGFDAGTQLDIDASTEEKIVFTTAFHHMDDGGSYDGWTNHSVTVRPSLLHGFTLTISGRNRNDIKDYIGETFHQALSTDIE